MELLNVRGNKTLRLDNLWNKLPLHGINFRQCKFLTVIAIQFSCHATLETTLLPWGPEAFIARFTVKLRLWQVFIVVYYDCYPCNAREIETVD